MVEMCVSYIIEWYVCGRVGPCLVSVCAPAPVPLNPRGLPSRLGLRKMLEFVVIGQTKTKHERDKWGAHWGWLGQVRMSWKEKLILGYVCLATGVFTGVLGHETRRYLVCGRRPLFCPFWEKGYCTECMRTIWCGVETKVKLAGVPVEIFLNIKLILMLRICLIGLKTPCLAVINDFSGK